MEVKQEQQFQQEYQQLTMSSESSNHRVVLIHHGLRTGIMIRTITQLLDENGMENPDSFFESTYYTEPPVKKELYSRDVINRQTQLSWSLLKQRKTEERITYLNFTRNMATPIHSETDEDSSVDYKMSYTELMRKINTPTRTYSNDSDEETPSVDLSSVCSASPSPFNAVTHEKTIGHSEIELGCENHELEENHATEDNASESSSDIQIAENDGVIDFDTGGVDDPMNPSKESSGPSVNSHNNKSDSSDTHSVGNDSVEDASVESKNHINATDSVHSPPNIGGEESIIGMIIDSTKKNNDSDENVDDQSEDKGSKRRNEMEEQVKESKESTQLNDRTMESNRNSNGSNHSKHSNRKLADHRPNNHHSSSSEASEMDQRDGCSESDNGSNHSKLSNHQIANHSPDNYSSSESKANKMDQTDGYSENENNERSQKSNSKSASKKKIKSSNRSSQDHPDLSDSDTLSSQGEKRKRQGKPTRKKTGTKMKRKSIRDALHRPKMKRRAESSDDESDVITKPRKKNKKKKITNRFATVFESHGVPLPRTYKLIPISELKVAVTPPSNKKSDGLRRSSRVRMQPLEFWKGECVEYGPNDFGDEYDGVRNMSVPVCVRKAEPTPYKPRKINSLSVEKTKKKTKIHQTKKEIAPCTIERFDDHKIRKKHNYIDDEVADIWDDNLAEAVQMKVVSRRRHMKYRDLPRSDSRKKSEGNVVGKAAQAFYVSYDYQPVYPGYIMGMLVLPVHGIKDSESVGSCAQTFTVINAQPNSIEVAYGNPNTEDGDMDHETAQRFLLGPGDVFRVPPGNLYRLQNHSKVLECVLSWTIIRATHQDESNNESTGSPTEQSK